MRIAPHVVPTAERVRKLVDRAADELLEDPRHRPARPAGPHCPCRSQKSSGVGTGCEPTSATGRPGTQPGAPGKPSKPCWRQSRPGGRSGGRRPRGRRGGCDQSGRAGRRPGRGRPPLCLGARGSRSWSAPPARASPAASAPPGPHGSQQGSRSGASRPRRWQLGSSPNRQASRPRPWPSSSSTPAMVAPLSSRDEVVVCDEASMVATRDLATLVVPFKELEAKLVLVGDHHQLGAVEAGGLFRLLVADAKTAELSTVRRFIDPWEAEATPAATRPGHLGDRRVRGSRQGRGLVTAGRGDRRRPSGLAKARAEGRSVVVMAADHATVDQLAMRARALGSPPGRWKRPAVVVGQPGRRRRRRGGHHPERPTPCHQRRGLGA